MDINEANKILLSDDNVNLVIWELFELANSEPENIESNDLELWVKTSRGVMVTAQCK